MKALSFIEQNNERAKLVCGEISVCLKDFALEFSALNAIMIYECFASSRVIVLERILLLRPSTQH